MEILFDLDTQARDLCSELGLNMVRAQTVGTHPRFVRMVRELIGERLDESSPRLALGGLAVRPDVCPADCCLMPRRAIAV
jgi:ferrochelatase